MKSEDTFKTSEVFTASRHDLMIDENLRGLLPHLLLALTEFALNLALVFLVLVFVFGCTF